MPTEPGSQFLKDKYDLHNAPEVEAAADRTNRRNELDIEGDESPEIVGQDPAARIENYLRRFTEITDRADPAERKDGIEAIKRLLHSKFVIKPDEVPEQAFLLEQRIAREQGWGEVEITDEFREKKTQQVISDQETSLDKWVDYLSSSDAQYPDWAKYWAIRSVLGMGNLQKQEDDDGKITARFTKRDKGTTASFPLLNPRALALTIGVLSQRLDERSKPKAERQAVPNQSLKLSDQEFQNLLSTENFSKIYGQLLIELPQYSESGLRETRGQWVKYNRGTDPRSLVDSLDGYPLEWCTANYDTAQTQLEGGDFYIYYSIDDNGQAKIPRAAIRMQGDSIGEVRGIAGEQNLDPYIADVVRGKMEEFPDGKSYEKKAYDMQMVTYIERKAQGGRELTKDDLLFLYEINSPIQGFGYQRDPRIAELKSQRNPEADMPIVFGCQPTEIAHSIESINEQTKAYVGKLEPGIFDRLPQTVEHIYTKFPENKINRIEATIGGKTRQQLEREMKDNNVSISENSEFMLNSPDFKTLDKPETIMLIRLRVQDLGFDTYTTIDQLYTRAHALGLELCPSETGPHLRLQDLEQPLDDWYSIGMQPIAGRDGRPSVFYVAHYGSGLWLYYSWADPTHEWNLGNQFVFRLRKHDADT